MVVTHRRHAGGHEIAWPVDLAIAGRAQRWVQAQPARLESEVVEMAEYFPRWILACAQADQAHLVACRACGDLVVPWDGAWRCLACRKAVGANAPGRLAWVGHLPALWPDHPQLAQLVQHQALPAGHARVSVGAQHFLLVPLSAFYPDDWPRQPAVIRYSPDFLQFLGLTPGGAIHMYDAQRLCLYYPTQWNGVSVRAVLQQRVVNHLASLVKVAMGVPAHEAFIGRIHDQPWQPHACATHASSP